MSTLTNVRCVCVAAERLRGIDGELARRSRGEELDRAAEIARRGRGERAGALRQLDALDELGRNRAADVQAVVVAVGHVAERHAVEREAHAVLIEAAHRDARRPLVRAVGIGRLEVDAGHVLDRLERARAGRQLLDLLRGDRLHLARLAAAEHENFVRRLGVAVALRIGRRGEAGGLHRERHIECGEGATTAVEICSWCAPCRWRGIDRRARAR